MPSALVAGKPSASRLHALALPPACDSVQAWPYAPPAAALPGRPTTSDGCSGSDASDATSYACSTTGSAAPAGELLAGRAESPTATTTTLPAAKTASGGVAVAVGVTLGVRDVERVAEGVAVIEGVPLGLRVCVGVLVRLPVGVLVPLGVGVAEGVSDAEAPKDKVAVALVVSELDGVGSVGGVTLHVRLYAPLPKLAASHDMTCR